MPSDTAMVLWVIFIMVLDTVILGLIAFGVLMIVRAVKRGEWQTMSEAWAKEQFRAELRKEEGDAE